MAVEALGLQLLTGAASSMIGGAIHDEYSQRVEDRAYQRQLDMYNRMYEDNSPLKRREQLEKAGLSVGLMYGGATGPGGGTVNTPHVPEGSVNTEMNQGINILDLQARQKQIEVMDAQKTKELADAELALTQANKLKGVDTDKTTSETTLINENINNVKADTALKGSQSELNELQANSIKIQNEFNSENNDQLLKNNVAIGRKLIAEANISEQSVNTIVNTLKANLAQTIAQTVLTKMNVKLDEARIKEIANNISVSNKQLVLNKEKIANDLEIGIKANNNGIISKDVKGITNAIIEAFGGGEDYYK